MRGGQADGTVPYYCRRFETEAVRVLPGAHYVTGGGEMIVTLLGSCVAACVRDPVIGVGGLNHFMLPGAPAEQGSWIETPLRYGSAAMERLINDILKRGGHRDRLEIKLFGGGNILIGLRGIGKANADFVVRYLHEEGLKVAARDLGGEKPRRVHYFPKSGKTWVARLKSREEGRALEEENRYRLGLERTGLGGEVELFD